MVIGFIGDVHGSVFHAFALAATWQVANGKRFDLLVQVGDTGAFPDNERMDSASQRYVAVDLSQGEFMRLLTADGERADNLRRMRELLASPIHFIRGNHEDFDFLNQLPVDGDSGTASIDPFDLLRFVPDGTLLQFDEVEIAFLGGTEGHPDAGAINQAAYQSVMDLRPEAIDILVTHEGPYGTSNGYHGEIQGSRLISRLVAHLQPAFYVYEHTGLSGPATTGKTTYLGLNGVVPSSRWQSDAQGFEEGCWQS